MRCTPVRQQDIPGKTTEALIESSLRGSPGCVLHDFQLPTLQEGHWKPLISGRTLRTLFCTFDRICLCFSRSATRDRRNCEWRWHASRGLIRICFTDNGCWSLNNVTSSSMSAG